METKAERVWVYRVSSVLFERERERETRDDESRV